MLGRISDLGGAAASSSTAPHRALRKDEALNHIHWATTRRAQPSTIMALAIDHRAQLEEIADAAGSPRERISDFKLLAVEAAAKVAAGGQAIGMLLDGKYGREALFRAVDHDFWIGRPVELPGSRPLRFEFGRLARREARRMAGRAHDQVPVLLSPRRSAGAEGASRSASCCACSTPRARLERELLVEIIAGKNGPVDDTTVARVLERLYDARHQAGLVEARAQASEAAWEKIERAIETGDPVVPRRRAAWA